MFAQILRKPAQLRLTNWGGKDGSGEVLRRVTQLTSMRDCSADSMLLLKEGNCEKIKLKIHPLQILSTQREKVQMTPFRDRREKVWWDQDRWLGWKGSASFTWKQPGGRSSGWWRGCGLKHSPQTLSTTSHISWSKNQQGSVSKTPWVASLTWFLKKEKKKKVPFCAASPWQSVRAGLM